MKKNLNRISISQEIVGKVASRNIYFAHQSVGYNILDGIGLLTNDLNIVELQDSMKEISAPAFYHSIIGENDYPITKINDFHSKVINGLGDKTDIAFLKFCYVDFNRETDVERVFEEYSKAIKELEQEYPDVTFVHFTTPLTVYHTDLKTRLKRILGREVWSDTRNIQRQKYNEMIRETYSVVFDLAKIESTGLDGTRHKYSYKGADYYCLLPEFTTDGGHLNDLGAKQVAQKLMFFLSELE